MVAHLQPSGHCGRRNSRTRRGAQALFVWEYIFAMLEKGELNIPNREGHKLVNECAGGPNSCEGSRRDTRQGETRIYAAGRQWLDPT
jgi:hypothetical protein